VKRDNWYVPIMALLISFSALLFYADYRVFGDARGIWFWVMSSVAFLPLQVALVTLVLEQVLSDRERRERLRKMNMVIGAFFSEAGIGLLRAFGELDPDVGRIRSELKQGGPASVKSFRHLKARLAGGDLRIAADRQRLEVLRAYVASRRDFLLRLLQNPNLLEHDTFSELLLAVFHLTEELAYRQDLSCAPDADCQHLNGDVERAYSLLVREWLAYMEHLRADYPYLFSLALRTNPFDPEASVEIRSAT
jgi:hypothetical protein